MPAVEQPIVVDPVPEPAPIGPATIVAVPTAAILAVWAAIQGIVAGEVTNGVLAAGIPALVVVVTWLVGRFAQAYAKFRDAASPSEKIDVALATLTQAKATADEVRGGFPPTAVEPPPPPGSPTPEQRPAP